MSNWNLGSLLGIANMGIGAIGNLTPKVDIQGANGGAFTDIVQGTDMQGNIGTFDLDSPDLKPGSVTSAFGSNAQTFNNPASTSNLGSVNDTFSLNKPGTGSYGIEGQGVPKAGGAVSGLGGLLSNDNMWKALQLGIAGYSDYENRKFKKDQVNLNTKKYNNNRERNESVWKSTQGIRPTKMPGSDLERL